MVFRQKLTRIATPLAYGTVSRCSCTVQVPTRVAVSIKQVPTKVALGVKALADGDDNKEALVSDILPKAAAEA